MREIMKTALCGDDVYGEDSSISELESLMAKITGKEDSLFVLTGTMGNLLSLMSLCDRGDEVICGDLSHLSKYEQGNISQFGGIPIRTLKNQSDGSISISDIMSNGYFQFNNPDFHCSMTKVICLENTHNMLGGIPLQIAYLDDIASFANEHGVLIHTDGARLINAAIAQGLNYSFFNNLFSDIPINELCKHTDTVSICFTKGLGCPFGAIIAGSTKHIAKAKRLRKALGGQWRQGGIAARCCSFSIKNLEPIRTDHENAKKWAESLKSLGFNVQTPASNIVLIDMKTPERAEDFISRLAEKGVFAQQAAQAHFIRGVFHRSVDYEKLDDSIASFASLL